MSREDEYKDGLLRVEHRWDTENDRWIYIEHYESGYLGLNFMQGNEYESFKEGWCKMDRGLSEFYNENNETIKKYPGASAIETINAAMWLYHSAIANYEWNDKDVQYEFNNKK
jgi:hypothetical protein